VTARKRCSDLSRAAGEPLAATAPTAERWLLLEVPGTWGRDVAAADGLPTSAQQAVTAWLARTPRSRLHFLRRRGRLTDRLVAFVVRADEAVSEVRRIEFAAHDELATVDFERDGELVAAQLVLVCGHGSRDACCALRGTAVYGALDGHVGDGELWMSSHQGGHRFAANVLVLPAGIQLGRVDPKEAVSITSRALAGRIELGHYRGRTCYDPPVQAAEHAIRQALGLEHVADLRLASVAGAAVRFRDRRGDEHQANVVETAGPTLPASCGAQAEEQRVLVAHLV
jgi:hypothetical protein